MKIISVVGARPNFMKMAPVHKAFCAYNEIVSSPQSSVGSEGESRQSAVGNQEENKVGSKQYAVGNQEESKVGGRRSDAGGEEISSQQSTVGNSSKSQFVNRKSKNLSRPGGIVNHLICHTGQHYDEKMSKVFFEDLELPKPDFYLGIGSGSHAEQTAKIMVEFEKVLLREKPDLVIVYGDVNSTVACALTAVKLNINVAHVEAGLRSGDRTMPEEINRLLTDAISDFLFVSEPSGIENLKREGVPKEKIFFVGNTMIDSLIYYLPKVAGSRQSAVASPQSSVGSQEENKVGSRQYAVGSPQSSVSNQQSSVPSQQENKVGSQEDKVGNRQYAVGKQESSVGSQQEDKVGNRQNAVGNQQSSVGSPQSSVSNLQSAKSEIRNPKSEIRNSFILVTLHRPSNVDDETNAAKLVSSLNGLAEHIEIKFPIHPRTKNNFGKWNLLDKLSPNIILTEPVPYIEFIGLIKDSALVLTDSGGIQEETTWLGVPCVTLRANTERPVTVTQGTNILVGTDIEKAVDEAKNILNGNVKKGTIPELWDGKAASRIVDILLRDVH